MQFIAGLIALSAVAAVAAVGNAVDGAGSLRSYATVTPVDEAALDKVETDRCTTIIVGPKAGVEGAMTTHTADCLNCDFRINKVPATDWSAGTKRPLYIYRGPYPAVVSPHRGTTWHPSNLEGTPEQLAAWGQESTITGYVPQVAHTYALFEAGYGIMNEHQVAIGESTCAARFWGTPVTAGGKAQIEVAEMSKIALERSKTARQAIRMMGDLATSLGFYAADWVGGDASKGEAGEALTVIDKTEAWVFHVLGDDTGASAVWVAQRVPDDHVSVVANSFVIREIDPASDDFMFSSNIFEVAERNGLWSKAAGKKMDFLKTYAPQRSHPEYSTRRVWRTFNMLAPSLNLPGETNPTADDYPFSVKPDKKVRPEDLIALHRDHYEGTPYDLTKGVAAGPFGDPSRWDNALNDNMTRPELLSGGFERAISMFRTSYSFVAMSRPAVPDQLAMMWFGTYNPASSSYAPFYVAAESLPTAYTRSSLFNFDSKSAFWNFLAAGNYAGRFYKFAMQEVRRTQDYIHAKLVQDVQGIEIAVRAMLAADSHGSADKAVVGVLTDFVHARGNYIVSEWQALFPRLVTTYHDGMMALNRDQPLITMKRYFYPKWWLEATGYFDHKGTFGPDTILFAPTPGSGSAAAGQSHSGETVAVSPVAVGGTSGAGWYAGLMMTAVLSSLATMAVVLYVLQKEGKGGLPVQLELPKAFSGTRHEYTPINSNNEL